MPILFENVVILIRVVNSPYCVAQALVERLQSRLVALLAVTSVELLLELGPIGTAVGPLICIPLNLLDRALRLHGLLLQE